MFNRIIPLLLILTVSAAVLAQDNKKLKQKIARLEAKGHYIEAANLYRQLHDGGEREASISAAMNLYKGGKYQDALGFFYRADSLGFLDDKEEIFAFFDCLRNSKQYDEADQLILTHLANNKEASEFLINSQKKGFYSKISAYGNSKVSQVPINTKSSEFGPTIYDGWLYFESTRKDKVYKKAQASKDQALFNVYTYPIGEQGAHVMKLQGSFDKPAEIISSGTKQTESIPAELNGSHNVAPVYITPDGKLLFFTTNWHHEGEVKFKNPHLNLDYSVDVLENTQKLLVGKINLNIYYSVKEGNTWKTPVTFPYNSDQWSNQHAFFDISTSTMYFSSNMPGGYGGFDIWKSTMNGSEWSTPENLGPNINSIKEEVFPLVSPEGYLIFASNSWPGLGGLDLFLSQDLTKKPLNLLAGINSESDDFGMTFAKKGLGYMVSNRQGTVGDDDIFLFEADLDDIIEYYVPKYKITFVDAASGKTISGKVRIKQDSVSTEVEVGPDGKLVRWPYSATSFEIISEGFEPSVYSVENLKENAPLKISLTPTPPPVIIEAPVVSSPVCSHVQRRIPCPEIPFHDCAPLRSYQLHRIRFSQSKGLNREVINSGKFSEGKKCESEKPLRCNSGRRNACTGVIVMN